MEESIDMDIKVERAGSSIENKEEEKPSVEVTIYTFKPKVT